METLPLNVVLSPDGRDMLVVDSGRGLQYLQLVSTRTLHTVQRVSYPGPKGLFVGITYSDHGRRVYASGGGQNVVHTFNVSSDGRLSPRANIELAGPRGYNPFPVGLTVLDHDRILMVAENHDDTVAIIRLSARKVVERVPVGTMPYEVIAGAGSNLAYVSNSGSNSVSAVSISAGCGGEAACSGMVVRTIPVRAHPTAMTLGGGYLYVANSNSDAVSVISTRTDEVVSTILVRSYLNAPLGSSPEGLSLSRDGRFLYVANSGDNALIVVKLLDRGGNGEIIGRIPTAEYPTSVTPSIDGNKLYVTNAFGDGTVPDPKLPIGSFVEMNGSLSTIRVPGTSRLQAETNEVMSDNNTRSPVASEPPVGSPIPLLGGKSPIKHVIYIIKENQTYDQVFGDLKGADGDSGLTRYGVHVTPNLHALARRFGILDNFYDDGLSSSDGHNWVMSANDDDFNEKMWPEGYSKRGEFGLNPGASIMDLSPGGYLWDQTDKAGVSYRDYGEFYQGPVRDRLFLKSEMASSCLGSVAYTYVGMSIPKGDVLCLPPSKVQPTVFSLIGHYDPRYRGLDMKYSDIDRVREWEREFTNFVQHDDLPALEFMWLPNDHTAADAGYLTPKSYVAQNDRAVGLLVDAVSHSRYWASTAIFITEDDPQGARDHVNSQRTEGLVISPYTQTATPAVDSELYDNSSMVRTIELILGLKPMSEFDATADPMWRAFHRTPDLRPFTALPLGVAPTVQH